VTDCKVRHHGHLETQHRIRHADGSYRWVLGRALVVQGADGIPSRLAGSLTDITNAKMVDALTGLPNRAIYLDRLRWFLERGRRWPDRRFAVVVIDLDRLKTINDTLGHGVGDQLLAMVGHRLERNVRTLDLIARLPSERERAGHTVARIGGDEFTLLLGDLGSADDALVVAERVRESLQAPFTVGGRELFISASIGVALWHPGVDDAEQLLRDADLAMYQAKALGGNRVQLFDLAMHGSAVQQLMIETDLRAAIRRGGLTLSLQPIVGVDDQVVRGFEALVRWNRDGVPVSPADFIPVAEKAGLVYDVDMWVLREVCGLLASWNDQPVTVSVNLSGQTLMQPDLVERIEAVLAQTGARATQLEVEVTETAAIDSLKLAGRALERIKALGVRLSLDDFGTGYSSLSYLRRLPIDIVKIDRSFIGQMGRAGADAAIVEAVAGLAERLGLGVVAEGVETLGQLHALRRLRVARAQGYYFARSLAPLEARALLGWSILADSRQLAPAS
jgi:predicted signal transduction protein with EAL and GGDEF domain